MAERALTVRAIRVVDIETRLGDEACALAGGGSFSIERAALHEVVAAAVLSAELDASGRFGGVRLTGVDAGRGEAQLLVELDRLLMPAADGGVLVTFNGAAHDLPVLRRRADRHWLFDLFSAPGWTRGDNDGHVDLAVATGRRGSLIDACAGLGFSAAPWLARAVRTRPDPAGKARVDVAATFMLYAYGLSREMGSAASVASAWLSLSAALRRAYPTDPDLEEFTRNRWVVAAAGAIA